MLNLGTKLWKLHSLTKIAAVAAALVAINGCASKYTYQPYDIVVDERLAALEERLREQRINDATTEQSSPQAERLDRIERQLDQITAALAVMVADGKVDDKSLVIEDSKPIEPEAPVVQIAEPVEPAITITKPSEEFQFGGWSNTEKKVGRKFIDKFTADADMVEFRGNRADLMGSPLSRRHFLGPTGDIVNLDDWKGEKNVLLIFHRGFAGQVCISCSVYTVSLVKAAKEFESRNTQVFIIYPGDSRSIPAFLEAVKNVDQGIEVPYPLLLDVDLGAVQELMIEGALAKPTAILIGKDGTVKYAYTGKRLDDRPSVPTLLAEIEQIGS